MKIVFVAYNHHPHVQSPAEWIQRIQPMTGIMQALTQYAQVYYAGRIGYQGKYLQEGVEYIFPDTQNDRRFFPKRFHAAIAALQPDVCIVLGLHFPVQLIQLKRKLGRRCIIIARHHADQPGRGIRKMIQRWADRYTSGYLFNSKGNADEWIKAKIIPGQNKILELPAGSTNMKRQDSLQSHAATGMNGSPNFLWVGRLDENKDPLTVIKAFEQVLDKQPLARLYLVYQQDQLIDEVKRVVDGNERLKRSVVLVGKVSYEQLPYWYSAANYYISSSYREGGSYALLEAMACGSVPVVTNIPASVKAIGDTGYVFEPGDVNGLASLLSQLDINKYSIQSALVQQHFQQEFSPAAIAGKLFDLIRACNHTV